MHMYLQFGCSTLVKLIVPGSGAVAIHSCTPKVQVSSPPRVGTGTQVWEAGPVTMVVMIYGAGLERGDPLVMTNRSNSLQTGLNMVKWPSRK